MIWVKGNLFQQNVHSKANYHTKSPAGRFAPRDKTLQGRVVQRSRLGYFFWLAGRVCSMQLLFWKEQTVQVGQAVIGSCLFYLNVVGQFQLSKKAAQLNESDLGLEIWLGCDVMAWGIRRITVHAGKIGQIS